MPGATLRLDLTLMYAMHDALRREAEHLAWATTSINRDPRRVVATAAGWEMFKTALRLHHASEDEALWPVLARELAARPDELALVIAMEAQHKAIDAIVGMIDTALADPGGDVARLGDLADLLVTAVGKHLRHEEGKVLPLVEESVTEAEWARFGELHAERTGPDASWLMPWLLEDASADCVELMLGTLPEPQRTAYLTEWQPAYRALDRWAAGTASVRTRL